MRIAWLLLCAALDGGDPAGTVVLQIEAGQSAPIQAQPGSNVICDDLAVVSPDFSEDGKGFVLRAHKAGTTLCGVWIGDQQPAGLYRVNVSEKKSAPESPKREKDPGGHQ